MAETGKPATASREGTLIVRIDNFFGGFIKPWKHLRRLKTNIDENILYGLREYDLLINRVNSMSHIGKCGLVHNLTETCVFESNMMRVSLNLVFNILPI